MIEPRKKILVVEDHDDTRKVVVLFLEMCKYQVESAGTRGEAVALLAAGEFDVLVADLGLPDGNGMDLMRLAANPRMVGIALTGRDGEQDVAGVLAAGFSIHLTKPADFNSLKQAVERLLTGENG